jgi:uncharacterized protein (TIGR03000 family)
MPTPAPEKIGKPKSSTMLPAPATIVVSLPQNAKLMIDDNATSSTSTTRVFTSPALEVGTEFNYTLKAELVVDGRTVTASKQVAVHAGDEISVSLQFPETSLAQR